MKCLHSAALSAAKRVVLLSETRRGSDKRGESANAAAGDEAHLQSTANLSRASAAN